MNEKDLFFEALETAVPERAGFLDRVCAGDPEKRKRLEELLASHSQPDHFMEAPAVEESRVIAENSGGLAGTTIGRYKLLELIGEGGFGSVYLAEQGAPVRRKVALKIIKLGMDTRQVVARFAAEQQALAVMEHPNIAKVLDAGATESGRPFFVMELVLGERITDFCARNELSVPGRLRLFLQVCDAIQHAHQKGIIHRDIKPSNIVVTQLGGAPAPKVIDFGIAKAIEGDLTSHTVVTQLHQFIGTPAYMSPEQAEMTAHNVDTRTDIYALGAVLYELLTGVTPFDARDLTSSGIDEMRRVIREQDPARPSTRLPRLSAENQRTGARNPGIDGDLDWIVLKCLEKDRARRYDSVGQLASDLQRYLANETVSARPPTTLYRLQKAWRRNWRIYIPGLGALAALIAGTVVSTWQAVEANKARRIALGAQAAEKEQRLLAEAEKTAAQKLLYSVDMPLAQQAWESNDFARLRKLLDETESYSGRGWEWHYWKRQSQLAYWKLHGHAGPVKAVAFAPDGRQILTGSADGTAKIWSVETHGLIASLDGHTAEVNAVSWSGDGRWIATGSDDHSARIWSPDSGREVLRLNHGLERVETVAFSPDSRSFAAGGNGGTLVLCRMPGGAEILRFTAHPARITSIVFSPDGKRMATAGRGDLARIWDAETGELVRELGGPGTGINTVAFAPDGLTLATASDEGLAAIWKIETGEELASNRASWSWVNDLKFSPDGQRVATGGDHWSVNIWNARDGSPVFTHRDHAGEVYSVAFSPDGNRILSGSSDGAAILADFAKSRERVRLQDSILPWTYTFSFSPDSRSICASGPDSAPRVWDLASGRETLRLQDAAEVSAAAYSRDGKRILGIAEGRAGLWDAQTGLDVLSFGGHAERVRDAEFSPDDLEVASAGEDCAVRIWSASTAVERMVLAHPNFVSRCGFSPAGDRIVTACYDRLARVWDVRTGQLLFSMAGHSAEVLSASYSPDGQSIMTAGDLTVRLWDAGTGALLHTFSKHKGRVVSAAFSPDGSRVFSTAIEDGARVWDSSSGEDLLLLRDAAAFGSRFSPDGRHIVSNWKGGAAVWTIGDSDKIARRNREDRANELRSEKARQAKKASEERRREAGLKDEGCLKRWLIAAPIPIADAASISPAEEAAFAPRAGDSFPKPAGLVWKELALPDHEIDLKAFSGGNSPDSVGYAVTYLFSDTPQNEARMLVGTDDKGKVYLNGEAIYESTFNRGFLADEDIVENVRLRAGLNVVVLKIINEGSDWKGSLRFTDAAGAPLTGIRVTAQSPSGTR